MEQIIIIIGPTFFAIALGYLFGRVTHANAATLIDVAMFIATPCLVFSSTYASTIQLSDAVRLWASCLLTIAGTFVLAWLAFGFRHKGRSALYLPIIFGNSINIPLPVLYLTFGDEGVATAVLYNIPCALLIYTLGIYLASGKKGLRQGATAVLRMPLIYATILGLVLNVTGVVLPEVMITSFKFVGQAAVPLMLLVLGMSIGGIRFAKIPVTLMASFIRMGGGFAVALLAVWMLDMTGVPRAVVIFQGAMPSAVLVSVLCTKYKNEAELVSSIVLTTTLMAVGVIPVLLYYLT